MPHFDAFAVAGVVMVFILLGVLLLIPSEKRLRKKKRNSAKKGSDSAKDWKDAALKLERHIHALRQEISVLQKRDQASERKSLVQEHKYEKLKQKIAHQKGWKEKEGVDLEKKTNEVIQLRTDLKQTEHHLQSEHGQRLKLERAVKSLEGEVEQLTERNQSQDQELDKSRIQNDEYRKQVNELKAETAHLKKEKVDTTFVARSDFEKVERELKVSLRELERLRKSRPA